MENTSSVTVDLLSFQAVIFDMDGVVVDTERVHFDTTRNVFKELGIILTDEHYANFVGHTTNIKIQNIINEFGFELDIPFYVKELRKAFEDRLENYGADARPGFFNLVKYLKENRVSTALCTSSTRDEAEYMFEKILRNHPEYDSMDEIFDIVITADDVTHRKPHPEPYLKAIKGIGAIASDCLVFEDTATGITAAKDAGCGVCIALNHPYNVNKLAQADWTIDSLEEML